MAQSRPGDPGRRGDPAGRFGSTVAGRYRLDEPRHGDLPGAERWTATDQILARRVTVTLVTGPRAAAVLDAARRAALVVDPRLARILDVGTADGTGYVVTEAVDGRSLAALAARAPLAPDQARAVVGEAAAALEVARRRGVHHLALRPETVVLTSGSRVVVEGLAVDGELLDAAGGGAHAMSRTDTVGLVRVLYAALTGQWPAATTTTAPVPTFEEWASRAPDGPSASVDPGLPAAPDHDGSPTAPADLVPGVPADLDTLCVVTLGPHDDGPHSPGELVRELEPWRAVRADEVFRAADSGRWPALTDSPVPPRADGGTPTGTTTAPPTGSSPMSDDQQRTSPTADGDTPAEGSPAAGAGGGAAAAGGAAGAAAATGTTAGATGTGAVPGVGAAAATGEAAATAAGAGAGAAAGTAAAGGGVARQSVRSAFGAAQGPGTRRPGTPPPPSPSARARPDPRPTARRTPPATPRRPSRPPGPGRRPSPHRRPDPTCRRPSRPPVVARRPATARPAASRTTSATTVPRRGTPPSPVSPPPPLPRHPGPSRHARPPRTRARPATPGPPSRPAPRSAGRPRRSRP
ncbi:protein kinase family protein [Cellulomonas sp. C5510]|uniref:protein kinase family protein n=1 Tax=Cellulomonas sp. C5510 TaxID=2871170 RepID=UPI001C96836D|nr:protein kinase family protein [Cellulomonas sp. C5510]QZN85661.1 protein kinase family protein [Cellulomonas sp. C5510]